jgi:hypothetical protein
MGPQAPRQHLASTAEGTACVSDHVPVPIGQMARCTQPSSTSARTEPHGAHRRPCSGPKQVGHVPWPWIRVRKDRWAIHLPLDGEAERQRMGVAREGTRSADLGRVASTQRTAAHPRRSRSSWSDTVSVATRGVRSLAEDNSATHSPGRSPVLERGCAFLTHAGSSERVCPDGRWAPRARRRWPRVCSVARPSHSERR